MLKSSVAKGQITVKYSGLPKMEFESLVVNETW